MAKSTTIPVRLETEQGDAVKQIAAACRIGEADVIRWAVSALRDYYEHHGKRLLLPLRFNETFSITKLDPTKPLVLHEPPVSSVRPELVRPEDSGRKNKPAQKATARD